MRKWLATQTMNFNSQLEAGIRFFDLRISTKPRDPDNELFFAHGLFSATVSREFCCFFPYVMSIWLCLQLLSDVCAVLYFGGGWVWGWYVCTSIPGPWVHEISFGKIWNYNLFCPQMQHSSLRNSNHQNDSVALTRFKLEPDQPSHFLDTNSAYRCYIELSFTLSCWCFVFCCRLTEELGSWNEIELWLQCYFLLRKLAVSVSSGLTSHTRFFPNLLLTMCCLFSFRWEPVWSRSAPSCPPTPERWSSWISTTSTACRTCTTRSWWPCWERSSGTNCVRSSLHRRYFPTAHRRVEITAIGWPRGWLQSSCSDAAPHLQQKLQNWPLMIVVVFSAALKMYFLGGFYTLTSRMMVIMFEAFCLHQSGKVTPPLFKFAPVLRLVLLSTTRSTSTPPSGRCNGPVLRVNLWKGIVISLQRFQRLFQLPQQRRTSEIRAFYQASFLSETLCVFCEHLERMITVRYTVANFTSPPPFTSWSACAFVFSDAWRPSCFWIDGIYSPSFVSAKSSTSWGRK